MFWAALPLHLYITVYILTNTQITQFTFDHSHKKRIVGPKSQEMETRAELAVLRTYVENQAILEPIIRQSV